ncbi:WD40-repeat-containing domain [Trinorchestia longiramus]|nr:WD40-repeat-containing domain [Trinorchestia longiramus]
MNEYSAVVHNVNFFNYTPSEIQRLAYDVTSNTLAVARCDNSIELWNCSHYPVRLSVLRVIKKGRVECLVWSRGRLFCGNLNGTISEVRVPGSGQPSGHEKPATLPGGACWSLAVNKQDTLVAAGSDGGHISLFTLVEEGLQYDSILETLPSRVVSVAWHDGGGDLVAACGNSVYIRSLKPKKLRRIIIVPESSSRPAQVWCVALLPDFTVVAGDSMGTVSFWSASTCTQISSITAHEGPVLTVAVNPTATAVYAAGVDPKIQRIACNESSQQWHASHLIEGHSHDVHSLVVAPNGRVYSGGVDTMLGVHWYPPKTVFHISDCPPPGRLSMSSDSVLLAQATWLEWWRLPDSSSLYTQDAGSPTKDRVLMARIELREEAVSCDLNPAATSVACVTGARNLRIWRLCAPNGESQASLSKLRLCHDKLREGTVRPAITRLLWLGDHALAALTINHDVEVWGVGNENGAMERVLRLPRPPEAGQEEGGLDSCVLHMAASRCGGLLAVATLHRCVVFHIKSGSVTQLPPHRAAISAICVHSENVRARRQEKLQQKQRGPSGRLAVAYADLTIAEFSIPDGAITPFGEKVNCALNNLQSLLPVIHLSWCPRGEVLCLHDTSKAIFMRRKTLLEFNWNSLQLSSLPGYERYCEMKRKLKENTSLSSDKYRKKEVLLERKEAELNTALQNLKQETWSSLTRTLYRPDDVLLQASLVSSNSFVAVQVKRDSIMENLPGPLKKFKHSSL